MSLIKNMIKLHVMTVFDLHSIVVKISLDPLLTLLIASVKCKWVYMVIILQVFFKVVLYLFLSIHLEFVFIILEFNVYFSD